MIWQIIFSDSVATWLTAIGTIGAVVVAVGQNIVHNRKTEKEYNTRSNNAREFITALLSTHKMYFAHYSTYKYDNNKVDIIETGDLSALDRVYRDYNNNKVVQRANNCMDDIKFAIRNVGIQTDSATIKALSEQINALNDIETAFNSIDIMWKNHQNAKSKEISELTKDLRHDLRIIDASLQKLSKDLTDKAFVNGTTVDTLGEINSENENNSV
ncbi:hypothetical protein [Mammaliicoccus sciuri]|uniref:hypothetical protein n=1 Tax=Mammaliicoccus sciuri TaxID=1296 RepID=UPI000D1E14BD|nr:hypothetical protein [Mammaliicoccus sciuri]PTJ54198.1 hypothetical protein BU012_00960 [Mammaliicoccus sciuri]